MRQVRQSVGREVTVSIVLSGARVSADKTVGAPPLPVTFTSEPFPEGLAVQEYRWDLDGDGVTDLITADPSANFTYTQQGAFVLVVSTWDANSLILGVGQGNQVTTTAPCVEPGSGRQYAQPPSRTVDLNSAYTATIRTNKGKIVTALLPSSAPNTVNNFIFLAQDGFYDCLIFHRVIEKFMIQGGDPTGTGASGPGYKFEDEIDPSLIFDRPGVLAMANAGPDTNGSQFFITTVPSPHLNGIHTIFARVLEGQGVLEAISKVATSGANKPKQPVIIQSIDITKNGATLPRTKSPGTAKTQPLKPDRRTVAYSCSRSPEDPKV